MRARREGAHPPGPPRGARKGGVPESPREAARALALRVLAHHARTTAQLRDRLARAGLEAEAEATLAWLAGLGYLDDAAYARARARTLLAGGRAGPRRAVLKLRAEGIDGPAAEAAVARAAAAAAAGDAGEGAAPADRDAELALCRGALARKLRGADPSGLALADRARLYRFLLGRGFSAEAVARALGRGAEDGDP